MSQRILVWDVPTRVFHWLLVISFAGAFLTAESERYRNIHVVLGYTLLGLIAFRLFWGLIGSRYAQFRSFLFRPGEIAAYLISLLKAKPAHYVGHNPAGSVAVYLLLALGIAVGATGATVFQDIGGDALEELHEMVSYAMLTVVGMHLVGVLVSSLMHRENLVRAMITGFKSAQPNVRGNDVDANLKTLHARFPLPNPDETTSHSTKPTKDVGQVAGYLPEGEGANESLRKSRTNEGIRRAHTWVGVIMLVAVVGFWLGYPATGLVQPSSNASQAGQHHDDD